MQKIEYLEFDEDVKMNQASINAMMGAIVSKVNEIIDVVNASNDECDTDIDEEEIVIALSDLGSPKKEKKK